VSLPPRIKYQRGDSLAITEGEREAKIFQRNSF
jgi:hypothetical protein